MIFCDLDGTLVSEDNPDYSKRRWLPRGRELWSGIRAFDVSILSYGKGNMDVARRQKEEWCAVHLGTHIPVIVVEKSTPKADFAKAGDILIDNGEKHRSLWLAAGGEFFLFPSELEGLWNFLNNT